MFAPRLVALSFVSVSLVGPSASAQAPRPGGAPPPAVVSPEVGADRSIAFRLLAPKAQAVRLAAGDIPGSGRGAELKKNDQGVWEVKVGPVQPGTFRYRFNVDGVDVVDPRNPAVSESNALVWSLVHVPGEAYMDIQDVPHGAVAEVVYNSKSLGRVRRLHVYTPPGYETSSDRYPVFYLLHGASDSDDSWSTVGRAGVILDNLIAAGKAKPMIVVMPAGHTRAVGPGGPRPTTDEFVDDFVKDVMPLVDGRYRTKPGRENRALAGLSMGGGQTINIAIPRLDQFAYLGVYSSGVFGIVPRPNAPAPKGPTFEERFAKQLDDAESKKGLKLFWFGTGKEDFLLETSRATVAMFKKRKFDVVYDETAGGHTWIVWRQYLRDFAPKLFQ